MERITSMQHFIEVVKNESFTAAAEKLSLSRAQISKSIMHLEQHLGTRLLNRTTRRVSLTDIGKIYFQRCQLILEDIEEMEGIASEQTEKPSGVLKISAPTSFGILHLQHLLPEYLKKYPDVQISLSLNDRFVDIVETGIDVVLRISKLSDSSLIARKIAPCKLVLCASPEFLKQYGTPTTPQELTLLPCLTYSNNVNPNRWQFSGPQGEINIKVSGPFVADNGDILKSITLAGMGISLLPEFIVGPEIYAGKLQPILPEYSPEEIPIYAIFPSRRYLSAKVRTFVDFISDYYGNNPDWLNCSPGSN